ncbi:hypothetical protein J2X19_001772 [Rhodoferax ferrireducens]|uniref:Cell wall hydrolase SleB domain-containing protein n=1 Tax=Rhodoferax ferrireducens TaxID=192843 RepID=A0ABU2C6Z9_9BURK|nr:cell wall hydrolase [Rhodoferax ferrireducens]MDR7377114.1 hypothetical protein [Rhodoferax ferrireducens]
MTGFRSFAPTSPYAQLRGAFRMLGAALQLRQCGKTTTHAPDWADPYGVDSFSMQLADPREDPQAHWELVIALRDGIPGRAVPQLLHLGARHPPVRLRCVRAEPARAQAAPRVERTSVPLESGTATCLVRDRLNPDRYYVLTCGHVLAPTGGARWDDPVAVVGDAQLYDGRLREWQPSVGIGVPPSTIDAGLVELDAAAATALRNDASGWTPQRVNDDIWPDRPVRLLRHAGELTGSLKVHWSGKVCVPDGDEFPDYFLQDAIGYMTPEATRAGDSGGPVWTDDDALLGMHVAAIAPEGAYGANAVLGRIAPVLDWFCVKPFTRDDPATLGGLQRPAPSPRLPQAPKGQLLDPMRNEVVTLAKTLWAEARGEGRAGMEAVACVIMNRRNTHYRRCDNVAEVCLDPWQFSCWNTGDPNRRRLDRIDAQPDTFYQVAFDVAQQAIAGSLEDVTQGARHYHAVTMRPFPDWALGKRAKQIGNHLFYVGVA